MEKRPLPASWSIHPLPRHYRYWVPVSPPEGLQGIRRRDWPLVLCAMLIPCGLGMMRHMDPPLFVPCLLEKRARYELDAFTREEEAPKPVKKSAPPYPWPCGFAAVVLVAVALLHGWRFGDIPCPDFIAALLPSHPGAWVREFGLDTVRVKLFHEFYRASSALFIHADAGHIASNLAFAAIFLHILERQVGPGACILLCLLSGVLGNCLASYAHAQAVVSIGFSTALFGVIGATAGHVCMDSKERMLLPLAAAGGLLGLLGTEGESTDYTAHLCGLLAGIALGLLLRLATQRRMLLHVLPFQILCGAVGMALPLVWLLLL